MMTVYFYCNDEMIVNIQEGCIRGMTVTVGRLVGI